MKKNSKIAVLLAAYNGESWILEQIVSIIKQEMVLVDIFVSIDISADGTYNLLRNFQLGHPNLKILPYGKKFGGAAKNFYRLIKDVDISQYDYIAFADQDDIWLPNKLSQGIGVIELNGFDAYSSDVVAFWPDGRTKLIKKSYPQKKYDFMFESAGPGCTYILNTKLFLEFKKFIVLNWSAAQEIELHDWLIYSFSRSKKYNWFIDSKVTMYYRQHQYNQFGANASFSSYFDRLRLIRNGWYINQVFKISSILGLNMPNRAFILANLMQIRRNNMDALFLCIFSIFWGNIV